MSDHLAEFRQLYEQGILSEAAFVAAGGKVETHGANSVHVVDTATQMVIGGENNHVTAIINQVQGVHLTDGEMREEIGRYLAMVITENSHIRLTGIQRQGRNVMDLSLDEVYVPLAARHSEKSIPLTKLLQQSDHLVVTGGPGCGKSTVLMHIAWVLARGLAENNVSLAQQKLNFPPPPKPQPEPAENIESPLLPLPILIPLNRFADHLRRHQNDLPEQRTLARFISHYLIERQKTASGSALHTFFDQLLAGGKQVILLLDGLDEVPNEREREVVSQKIEDLVAGQQRLKVIVTCRTAAYHNRTALGHPFCEMQVQSLNKEQVAQLIRQAYAAVEPTNPTAGREQADDLIKGIERMEVERARRLGENAERLATSPLMARMLLIVHVSDRRLPEQRAELFKRAVENMLLPDYVGDTAVRNELGQYHLQHLELLQFLAFHMHLQGDKGREIDEQDMRRLLNGQEGLRPWVDNFISLTRQRGTLLEERLGVYRFIHLGFQEFLAARYMAEVLGYEQRLAEFILAEGRLADSWWREPFLLLAGYFSVTATQRAERLLRFWAGLGEWERQVLSKGSEEVWRGAELAGTALLEWPNANPPLNQEITRCIVALIEEQPIYSLISPPLRAATGSILALLSDPRAGVCTPEPVMLPVVGQNFEIAKHPVTNAQYRYFVEDGGYTTKWDKVWSSEGCRWRQGGEWQQPHFWGSEDFNQLNQPVVGVNWYEAEAYVNWLSEVTGQTYRLPTEEEWQKVAQNPRGGDYPWGEWAEGHANTLETNIGRTSAVGLFPKGVAYCGAHDMGGNVWEWTSSCYDANQNSIVVRGGSWRGNQSFSVVSYRRRFIRSDRDNRLGVRLVRVSHLLPL